MKNIIWLIVSIISFCSYAFFMQANESRAVSCLLNLSDIEALALDEELPEIEITCDSEEGLCWSGECANVTHTPFGSYRSWVCDRFTGSPSDACLEGMPC